MFASLRRFALPVLALAVLAACEKPAPPPPPPLPTLARPTQTVTKRNGRLLVPATAVVERGLIPGVYVLVDGREARFRLVRTGKVRAGHIEVLSGLKGDEILVAGDLREVRDGSPINAGKSGKQSVKR